MTYQVHIISTTTTITTTTITTMVCDKTPETPDWYELTAVRSRHEILLQRTRRKKIQIGAH